MRVQETRDRDLVEALLRRDPALHLYEMGDLDPFFWPATRWFLGRASGDPATLCLLYANPAGQTLIALDRAPDSRMPELLAGIHGQLPSRFYAHLSPELARSFTPRWRIESRARSIKMLLTDPSALADLPPSGNPLVEGRPPAAEVRSGPAREPVTALRLTPGDRAAVEDFYAESYPGNWFDPRMLETGHYYGVRGNPPLVSASSESSPPTDASDRSGALRRTEGLRSTPAAPRLDVPAAAGEERSREPLRCVAGVHVFSPRYRVAALGNIATHPKARRLGLARAVTSHLCRSLLGEVDTIGLNVHSDNVAAIACYSGLGFEPIAEYEEILFTSASDR